MSWVDKSKKINSIDFDVFFLLENAFCIKNAFYADKSNSDEQHQDQNDHETWELPNIDRANPTMASTSEVIEHIDELTLYYKNILEKSAVLGQQFYEIGAQFWLRLLLWNTEEEVYVYLPWYDTLSDMQDFFSWLKETPNEPFFDIEQGWQIDAVRIGENIHLKQFVGNKYINIVFPAEGIVQKVNDAENRAKKIISCLVKELGVDVWSNYIRSPEFGTETWPP